MLPIKRPSINRGGVSGGTMIRWLVAAIGFCVVATPVLAADPLEIGIGYLGHAGIKAKLSLVEQPTENDGVAGARAARAGTKHPRKIRNHNVTLGACGVN